MPMKLRNRSSSFCVVLAASLALVFQAKGQTPQGSGADSLFDLSFDQLSQVEIKSNIGSIKAKTVEELPEIVSVVSRGDFAATGARDLSEILMLVPGFALDEDVNSMVGLTFRGLQAQEGNAMLILDGVEINDATYGSLPILNHIPADMIQMVEIIRGPGSAMYGGDAGLTVIRVTTRGMGENGGYFEYNPALQDGYFKQQYVAGVSRSGSDWSLAVNTSFSQTRLSDRTYTALDGTTVAMADASQMNPFLITVGVTYHDLTLHLAYDDYKYDDPINYGDPPPASIDMSFKSLLADLKYDLRPASWLKVTPEFTYRHTEPWEQQSPYTGNWDLAADRYQFDLNSTAEVSSSSAVLVGLHYQRDQILAIDTSMNGVPAATFFNGKSTADYSDYAGYVQYDWDAPWASISAGGRYEHQNYAGGAFVPRLAATKSWGKFHVKAIDSSAFRIPAVMVIDGALGQLPSERIKDYEFEAGYNFGGGFTWTANVYRMEVDHPIIYTATVDPVTGAGIDGYFSGQDESSVGIESELRWDRPKFNAYLSLSAYRADQNNEPYVRADATHFLGSPARKVTASASWHVTNQLDWNLSGFVLASQEAYTYPSGTVTTLPVAPIFNTYASYRFSATWTLGLGIANLGNKAWYAPQPYNAGEAPLPMPAREFYAKISVRF
jgi:outer membrane receptor protein involved in Fe transport